MAAPLRAGRQPGPARQLLRTVCHTKLSPSSHSCRLRQGEQYDVVLSSGFLAFANHSGFLQAVEEAGISVAGVMGTSAGALAGSLYAAGYTPLEVAAHLRATPPIHLLRPSLRPWRGGLLSLDAVVSRLAALLPPTFEELERDFAVGAVTPEGRHVIIDSGPLPEAVAASAAIPFIFSGVDVPGQYVRLKDGGVVDRIGLKAWRDRRRRRPLPPSTAPLGGAWGAAAGAGAAASGAWPPPTPPALVHIIERSSPFSGADCPEAAGEARVHVVRSPKSGVSFFDLGDFDRQFDGARRRARPVLEQVALCGGAPSGRGGAPAPAPGRAPAAATPLGGGAPSGPREAAVAAAGSGSAAAGARRGA